LTISGIFHSISYNIFSSGEILICFISARIKAVTNFLNTILRSILLASLSFIFSDSLQNKPSLYNNLPNYPNLPN
ncbi:hypothetical protein, partial [Klebsiella pneumoniae]|uniref:hypothetical protein n=1 Tax=Klebsiella pneumoniae TaxID=573 RepID=UPI003A8136DD